MDPPGGEGPENARRAYLREFLAAGIEGHRTRELQDEILILEASATATVDGEEIGYRRLPVAIRREADRGRRARLEKARLEVVSDRLNPLHLVALERAHGVADELLGASYEAYCERLSGIDFDALERRTEAFLEETRELHLDLLGHYVGRLLPEADLEDLRIHDLARLLHGHRFERLFPGDEMVARIEGTVSAMGLDPTAQGRIEFDLEERPGKSPRAFCAAVRVPEEIKLVILPHGGHDDWATFLHELGHALHFAHVDPESPMEFRRLGDNGVTEAYAMTFDHLLHLPPFLRRVVGVGSIEDFPRFAAFRDLVMIRRYAAKFSYERSLHRDGAGSDRAREYVERLTEATGARAPEALYLEDVDPHFYCVRYLRAWMLAGALHRTLRERFGEEWFRDPRAGELLTSAWSSGQRHRAETLAREELGVEELTFEPVMEMIRERV
ncbi:MAG: hypothetical protein R3199_06900 [Gemmatimonadota bacterium]|nr:hypothetical protein [Gemmatimonadota bacterium]